MIRRLWWWLRTPQRQLAARDRLTSHHQRFYSAPDGYRRWADLAGYGQNAPTPLTRVKIEAEPDED